MHKYYKIMALFLEKCPKFTCEGKCGKSCSSLMKIKNKKLIKFSLIISLLSTFFIELFSV